MLNMSERDMLFIEEQFGCRAQSLMEGSRRDLLDALNTLIDEKGFEEPDSTECNDLGRLAQRVYESIYRRNEWE